MADIFISYARADAAHVEPLAQALTEQGWSVWWDRSIIPGSTFDDVIEAELNAARCVIVVWSQASVRSHWVRDEAEEGQRRGLLTPVLVDNVRPPLGFRRVQAADLTDWRGSPGHAGYLQLLHAIRGMLGDATHDTANAHAGVEIEVEHPTNAAVTIADGTPVAAPPTGSPPVAGVAAIETRIPGVRLWLPFTAPLLAAIAVYLGLGQLLRSDSARITERFESLMRQPAVAIAGAPPATNVGDRQGLRHMQQELAGEIAAGLLTMHASDNTLTVRLGTGRLFRSGSDSIDETYIPAIARIGRVIAELGVTRAEVTGHTDNVPVRTLRFPSNAALSLARAQAVADQLRGPLAGFDLSVAGRGESEPLADNATPQGRAINRRVEITVPLG